MEGNKINQLKKIRSYSNDAFTQFRYFCQTH